jgi:nucleoside-diphosphate-sugar epimerase
MPRGRNFPKPRDPSQTASDKPGTVHRVIQLFIDLASLNEPLTLFSGDQFRQLTWTEEPGDALDLVIRSASAAGDYNAVGEEVVTIEQLAEVIAERCNVAINVLPYRLGDALR